MYSIVTAVFKTTIDLILHKSIKKEAGKLKDGDVTDQKFRGLIVREIDEVKSKLDGLSRKDLLASISFFEEGIELLYDVFDKVRSRSENGSVTTQAVCAEAFSFAEGVRNLELTDLDESVTRALSIAKKRFKDARREATRAFKNEALETADRILAMQYRVMATILETLDYPVHAVAPCRVCIKELNSLSAVQSNFDVELRKGFWAVWGLFGAEERRKIISSVCHVNRVIYDVTEAVGKDAHLLVWPAINTREDKVDPLRDERVTEVLRKQGMEHCCVTPWSFGQAGKEEHKLKYPCGIATNSSGQFIVADREDCTIKVFDSKGTFTELISLPNDNVDTKLYVLDVATDMNDNIYVLVRLKKPGDDRDVLAVYQFNNTFDQHHKFAVRGDLDWGRMTVTDSGKVLVRRNDNVVNVYGTEGQFVFSFGNNDILKNAIEITAANDGRVMVVDWDGSCVHIFSEHGDHLNKFKLQRCHYPPSIAFHRATEHVVVASVERVKDLVHVEIYTKDGEFVRSIQIHEVRFHYLQGMTVTTKGRIAAVCGYWINDLPSKVLVL